MASLAVELPRRAADPRAVAARAARRQIAASALARSRATPWIVPLLMLAGWQTGSATGVLPATILPAPAAVFAAGWQLTRDGTLATNLAISAARALAGLVIGGALGLILGMATAMAAGVRRLLDPTLQGLRSVPPFALIPLIILWLGIDEGAKIALIAWSVFFPLYINTFHGVVAIDRGLVEMARVYGMGRRALFRRVILPGALPSILTGVRFALGIMWLALIVAETIAANSGLGYMANQAREFSQTDVIVLTVLIYGLLGKLTDTATRAAERRLLRWNPSYGDA